jgi:ABC-type glycerol-3-phosphate transport system substrate-binding protein
MMSDVENPDAAWEFMKWWVSTDIQTSYAREVEAILGSAARHPTANVDAFKRLAWTVEEQQILLSQWEVTVGVPEIAGGYYTGRNLENAFREVVNNNYNPRDTFETYIQTINNEITRKRQEFGLPVGNEE